MAGPPNLRAALWVALLIGTLARAVVLPLPGTLDVPDWKATSFVASQDLLGIYGHGGSPPEERRMIWEHISVTTEYPPVSQLEMAIVGRVYRMIDPEFHDGPLLTTLIKLPGLLAEIVLVVALLTWGRRVFGEPASWAAIAFWMNPGIWLGGPVLGYLDAQMAVPATLALLAAADRKARLAGVLAAVAVLTKPQAVFVLPIIWMMVARRDGRWQLRPAIAVTASGLVVAAVALLPFVIVGHWPSFWRAVQRLGEHDLVSGTATNVWWVVGWAAGSFERLGELGWAGALSRPATMIRISTVVAAGVPNPRTVGTVLTAAAMGWAVWRCWRGATAPVAALAGAWCVLAYFMISGQVHENHAYLALPFLGIAAAMRPGLRPLYWWLSGAFALNLYLFYGFGQSMPPLINRGWTFIDMSVLLSIGYGALVWWLTMEVRAATRATGPATRPDATTSR